MASFWRLLGRSGGQPPIDGDLTAGHLDRSQLRAIGSRPCGTLHK
jgi:hypothetical protein